MINILFCFLLLFFPILSEESEAAIPKPPTNFAIGSRDYGVALSWNNPSEKMDNSPFLDFSSIKIYRDYVFYDSIAVTVADTGRMMEYVDSMQGYHYYQVYVYDNQSPPGRNWSQLYLGYGGIIHDYYFENFDAGRGLVTVVGTWDTTYRVAHSGQASFVDSPDSVSEVTQAQFFLPPVRITANHVLRLYEIGLLSEENDGNILITPFNDIVSSLGRTRIGDHEEWLDGSLNNDDWMLRSISLSQYQGDTVAIMFSLPMGSEMLLDGWFLDDIFIGDPLSVDDTRALPSSVLLEQNYPNPFNPSTVFTFQLPVSGYVTLKVYDVLGREVATLIDGMQDAGYKIHEWNASGNASGVYFYKLTVVGQNGIMSYSDTKKMLLLR